MARNLDEPGANFDQLLELALNLKNARAFAGKNGDYDWKEGDWTDPEDVDLYDWEPRPAIQEPRTTAQGTYGKYAQQIANGGRVGFENGGNVSSLVSWILKPENLERLKNNKSLVRQLTKNKMLPSSIRLYIRNLAGVTDKITEDFFSKSELKEIKRRVSIAEAEGNMGMERTSGFEQWRGSTDPKRGLIGYDFTEPFSVKGVLTNPKVNIDMTLGQAVFTKDKKGNIIVRDTHDFHGEGSVGMSYNSNFPDRKKEFRPDPYSAETGRFSKEELENPFLIAIQGRSGSYVDETDKEMRTRAHQALKEGDITTAGYARIIAQIDQQKEGIPIELNIGKISHEDKLKANPDFADYIAQDTKSGYGVEYEDVGIPSKIRKHAREYSL